jgi:SAM-dependent methyltransferase
MGADCTGIDLSDVSIAKAIEIRDELGLQSKFHACNVYDLDKNITEQFDCVFSSYGVITWLPDLEAWACQIAKRLKPGGVFVLVEFHPVLYMFDWVKKEIAYNYFNVGHPYKETELGTYANEQAKIEMEEYFWTHALSDVFGALTDNGMTINFFKEYDFSPYNIFQDALFRKEQEFCFEINGIKVPHVFALKAIKQRQSHLHIK